MKWFLSIQTQIFFCKLSSLKWYRIINFRNKNGWSKPCFRHAKTGLAGTPGTRSTSLRSAHQLLQHSATALIHASKGRNMLLPLSDDAYTVHERLADVVLRESHRLGMLLNSRELATLVHFPSIALSKILLGHNRTTKAALASLVDEPYLLGINILQGVSVQVGIDTAERLRHVHIIGSTGTGKSTLLHSFIIQDILNKTGCYLISRQRFLGKIRAFRGSIWSFLRTWPKGFLKVAKISIKYSDSLSCASEAPVLTLLANYWLLSPYNFQNIHNSCNSYRELQT